MFNTIEDPLTNKKINITSKKGRKILNNYIKHVNQNGGLRFRDNAAQEEYDTNTTPVCLINNKTDPDDSTHGWMTEETLTGLLRAQQDRTDFPIHPMDRSSFSDEIWPEHWIPLMMSMNFSQLMRAGQGYRDAENIIINTNLIIEKAKQKAIRHFTDTERNTQEEPIINYDEDGNIISHQHVESQQPPQPPPQPPQQQPPQQGFLPFLNPQQPPQPPPQQGFLPFLNPQPPPQQHRQQSTRRDGMTDADIIRYKDISKRYWIHLRKRILDLQPSSSDIMFQERNNILGEAMGHALIESAGALLVTNVLRNGRNIINNISNIADLHPLDRITFYTIKRNPTNYFLEDNTPTFIESTTLVLEPKPPPLDTAYTHLRPGDSIFNDWVNQPTYLARPFPDARDVRLKEWPLV